ncbi:Hypothetical predicted protein, partial [Mytilus galloprovincialis]
MNMLILLTILQIVSSNVAYNFTCPSSAHWKIRAKSLCEPPRNYTCLFDVTFRVNVYRERCSRPRILAEGYKYVFQPNLNRATCSATRYQPFIFDTNGFSDCTYQKSLCSSLGQETYEIGNTSVDRLCSCNTNKGYSFLSSSKQLCNCNPLTEDCSCYLGINQSNKTDSMKDIKCYDDVNLTKSPYLGDMFNNSRTIRIIEFDNFKYNLNYPTNRNKAAISIVILLLANFAVCIVVYRIKRPEIQFCRKIQKQHTKSLKVTNRNEHLIKDGTEIRRYVRIQVIGKDGVGKSSLVRRLVGDSNMKVHSTDGIDIVKKCQIRTTDGKWVIGRVETERKKIINRILDTLHKEQKQSELVSDQVIPSENETNVKDITPSKGPLSEIERKLENQPSTVSIDKSSTNENKVNITETATSVAEKSNIDKPMKDSVILSTNDFQKSADSIKIDDMRKKIFEQMDEILVKVQKDQDKMTSERLVECGIWDFAGQKDYYATHQTFLNPHAIYLLVTNISDDIAATEDDTNFDSIE